MGLRGVSGSSRGVSVDLRGVSGGPRGFLGSFSGALGDPKGVSGSPIEFQRGLSVVPEDLRGV